MCTNCDWLKAENVAQKSEIKFLRRQLERKLWNLEAEQDEEPK